MVVCFFLAWHHVSICKRVLTDLFRLITAGRKGYCGVSYEIQGFHRYCSCNFIPAGTASILSKVTSHYNTIVIWAYSFSVAKTTRNGHFVEMILCVGKLRYNHSLLFL